ncbi:MAG TPA: DNA alkylation repair protein [Leptolyngbyaceae cyanobacterium]
MTSAKIGSTSSVPEIIAYLQSIGSESHKKSLRRLGVQTDNAMGVPTPIIRQLAKKVGRNQKLALDLWQAGFHETKLLAVLVADPKEMSATVVEDWLLDVATWDLCDHLCNNLTIHLPDCVARIAVWAKDEREFFRRAAFSAIAMIMIHHKNIPNEQIDSYLVLIREYASDSRNYVKKAISWALREIGKRHFAAPDKAIILATELAQSTSSAERWVGKDALKELETLVAVPESRRLVPSHTKMGRKYE